ncbi:hypothetical protein D3C87_1613700 [compost metagenome]
MHVQQLQDLALGNHVGCIGEDLHDAHAAGFHHHLEGARIQEVAHQHAGRVAEHRVGGLAATAQLGFVHHVVVEQRGGVDELHHRGEFVMAMAVVAERARRKQQDDWTQPFAASTDDVFADLLDQGHFRGQAAPDDGIDGAHVGSDRGKQGSGGRLGQDGITGSQNRRIICDRGVAMAAGMRPERPGRGGAYL